MDPQWWDVIWTVIWFAIGAVVVLFLVWVTFVIVGFVTMARVEREIEASRRRSIERLREMRRRSS